MISKRTVIAATNNDVLSYISSKLNSILVKCNKIFKCHDENIRFRFQVSKIHKTASSINR